MSMVPFTNFTKGEISPELQARIDTDQYNAGTRKARNFIIQRYGGLSFRPGFRLVGEVDDVTKNVRYIPFQYNMEQAYIMALEDGRMRLLTQGGMVAEDNLKITAITNANTAQVTAAYHGFSAGDRIFLSGIVGMPELNNRPTTVVVVIDEHNFLININTVGFGTFVSSDGIVRTAPSTPPPADPPPPPAPPPPPSEPVVVGGGGTGSDTGGYTYTGPDGYFQKFNPDYNIP